MANSKTAVAPVEKFSEYIFKPDATHGKDAVFKSLGYSRDDAAELARTYEQQAAAKYENGDYELGMKDHHGQRIGIEIALTGKGAATGKTGYVRSGWMIRDDAIITLNTPFSGFTR
ncbi:MAG: hypothetical protein MSG64_01415 [Pyrinomonadaceae bacterium MAG19_C2-C3]|nr:hypothetical protein [Pyrinomonadaceae bacterium MAG19_C2-C3]